MIEELRITIYDRWNGERACREAKAGQISAPIIKQIRHQTKNTGKTKEVRELLKKYKGGLTTDQVALECGLTLHKASDMLGYLCTTGEVERKFPARRGRRAEGELPQIYVWKG